MLHYLDTNGQNTMVFPKVNNENPTYSNFIHITIEKTEVESKGN